MDPSVENVEKSRGRASEMERAKTDNMDRTNIYFFVFFVGFFCSFYMFSGVRVSHHSLTSELLLFFFFFQRSHNYTLVIKQSNRLGCDICVSGLWVTGLQPYTNYSFVLVACTAVGCGVSQPSTGLTLQAKPAGMHTQTHTCTFWLCRCILLIENTTNLSINNKVYFVFNTFEKFFFNANYKFFFFFI